MRKVGRLVVRSDGSLAESAWAVRFAVDTKWYKLPCLYLNTTKRGIIREMASVDGDLPGTKAYGYWCVITSAAVENPFRDLADAVAAALLLDGTVEEL